MIRKGLKVRIYPSKAQEQQLAQFFGCARWVYNYGLEKRSKAWEVEKKRISCIDLINELPKLKKQEETKWLKEPDSQSLQMSLRNLDTAFQRFFNGVSKYPRFKKKGSYQSCQIPQNVKFNFEDSKVYIPKIGWIEFRISKKFKAKILKQFQGEIKSVTISKVPSGKYFVSALVEVEDEFPAKPEILEETSIGIDLGLSIYATLSTEEKIENPRWLKKSIRKLRHLSRKHAKKKLGSNNRNKSRLKLAKYHEKVANQRRDFQHKLSKKLVSENQTICVETLNVEGMLQNKRLTKSISDASWSQFISILEYKCQWYGVNFIKIDQWEASTKTCSCGVKNANLTLADRTWTCSSCGEMHDRDILAANNIKKFGLRDLTSNIGQSMPEFKPAGVDCTSNYVETGIKQ
jgi:putative transposase